MKRAEYEGKIPAARALIASPHFDPDRDEWLAARAGLTCVTVGCLHENFSNILEVRENADGVYRAVCGHCSGDMRITLLFDDGAQVVVDPAPREMPARTVPAPRYSGVRLPRR